MAHRGTINYKEIVYQFAERNNAEPPIFHFQQDSKYIPCNYYCSVLVSGHSFSTMIAYKTKVEAEFEAARQVCINLNLLSQQNLIDTNNTYTSFSNNETFEDHVASPSTNFNSSSNQNMTNSFDERLYDKQPDFFNRNQFHGQKMFQKNARGGIFNQMNTPPKKKRTEFNIFHPSEMSNSPLPRNKTPHSIHKEMKQLSPPQPTPPPLELQTILKQVLSDQRNKPQKQSPAPLFDGPIKVSDISEIWPYITDDTLAVSFKTFLHLFTQAEQEDHPIFETHEVFENNMKGYRTTCLYKGQEFKSIGMMRHKKQGEMSAAEVCLRTMNYLPSVSSPDEYTIQPFRGGMGCNAKQKPYCFLLFAKIGIQLSVPHLIVKVKKCSKNESEFVGFASFDDKVFEGKPTSTVSHAKMQAVIQVLQYMSITVDKLTGNSDITAKLKDNGAFNFNLHFSVNPKSPFENVPSVSMGWLHESIEENSQPDQYTGTNANVEVLDTNMKILSKREVLQKDAIHHFLHQQPQFECIALQLRNDLSVCEIVNDHPDLVVIGNKEFSIKLFCKRRKVFCRNRQCEVELMAGHHIKGLQCNYVALPSYDVYLSGNTCEDLFFPNPSKPVVRSCSVVIIMHDQDAGETPHVLFQRSTQNLGFVSSAHIFTAYMAKLITGVPVSLDILELTANIRNWGLEELKLMTQMTMDAIQELYTKFQTYDNRWNEILMKPLTPDLKELKNICQSEFNQREPFKKATDQNLFDLKGWELPKSDFKPRLFISGPCIERSQMCAIRGLRNLTGIRLKLGDVDTLPVIDIPVKGANYRGAYDRFYIWARSKPETDGEEMKDTYFFNKNLDLNSTEWLESEQTKPNMNKSKHEANTKSQVKEKKVKHANEEEKHTQTAETTQMTRDDCGQQQQMPHDKKISNSQNIRWKSISKLQRECKWFPLRFATEINRSFTELSKCKEFQDAFRTLPT